MTHLTKVSSPDPRRPILSSILGSMARWAFFADDHPVADVSETNAVEQTTNGDGAVEQTKEEAVNGHADSESLPSK